MERRWYTRWCKGCLEDGDASRVEIEKGSWWLDTKDHFAQIYRVSGHSIWLTIIDLGMVIVRCCIVGMRKDEYSDGHLMEIEYYLHTTRDFVMFVQSDILPRRTQT